MWSTHSVNDSAEITDGHSGEGVLGIDVGGTKILGVRVVDGEIVDRVRIPSQSDGPSVVERIESVVGRLLENADNAPSGVGVGIAGFVGLDGIATTAPNTPGLIGADIGGLLSSRFGLPAFINNDANCAAVAAARGRSADSALLAVTLGTGIGGGFLINGDLFRGKHGYAAEPGHMVVDPNGPECPCGGRGCWERFSSGSGLGWLARRAAVAGNAQSLVADAGSIDAIVGETVSRLLVDGDPDAKAVFDEFVFYLALGVSNLIMLLDPDEVVISGGLVALGHRLTDPLEDVMKVSFPAAVAHRSTRVSIAELGEDAGAWGAAQLVIMGQRRGRGPVSGKGVS